MIRTTKNGIGGLKGAPVVFDVRFGHGSIPHPHVDDRFHRHGNGIQRQDLEIDGVLISALSLINRFTRYTSVTLFIPPSLTTKLTPRNSLNENRVGALKSQLCMSTNVCLPRKQAGAVHNFNRIGRK